MFNLVIGGISSTTAVSIAFPLGVMRTRLMDAGVPGKPKKYGTIMECFR